MKLDDAKQVRMLHDIETRYGMLNKGQILDVVHVAPRHPRSKVRILTLLDEHGTEFYTTDREVEAII